jgi:hypothetical protein
MSARGWPTVTSYLKARHREDSSRWPTLEVDSVQMALVPGFTLVVFRRDHEQPSWICVFKAKRNHLLRALLNRLRRLKLSRQGSNEKLLKPEAYHDLHLPVEMGQSLQNLTIFSPA